MKYQYRKHPSRLSTIMVSFGAGNRTEFGREYPCGIAHFMEHMRFKGATSRSAKELLQFVAYYGGEMNAWTSEDVAAYHITIPEENLEQGFQAINDIVYPTFPQNEVEKEREVVCQEIRAYDDDLDDNVYQEVMKWAFSNGLMYPVLGFEETVRKTKREDLVRFNKEFYTNEHMLVTLVSRNNHSYLVEKYIGIPDDTLSFMPPADKVEYGNNIVGVIKKDGAVQTNVSVSYGSQEIHDLIRNERAACKVFNMFFGANDDSKLFLRLREDLGLVYDICSSWHDMMDGTLFTIETETEPDKKDDVLNAILNVVEGVIKQPPTEEELQRAKNRLKSEIYSVFDTSKSAANLLVQEAFYGITVDSKHLADIDAVTSDKIQEIAKKIFDGNRYVAIGMGTD